MKQKYKDWIIENIRNGDFNSSTEWIEDFCDWFDLKKTLTGAGDARSTTFNKTLLALVDDELLIRWFRVKIPSFNGRGGGMLTQYQLTTKGYDYRDVLNKEKR